MVKLNRTAYQYPSNGDDRCGAGPLFSKSNIVHLSSVCEVHRIFPEQQGTAMRQVRAGWQAWRYRKSEPHVCLGYQR